ncbi:MAG: DUF4405 domain-containing protein [Gracilimonas sp.]|uniref:DUF4405 domain-containing protein n=1 Tax=Gracilimonas sp. TaxID=1974203 RepID=UPI0019964300|nr:DUF4405 domain-containing protein [Gracilimonas sp.]MBD3616487.1 DUF4405 domain-containing protein [Gracilimonas sp.]
MRKNTQNIVIDATLFLCLLVLLFTGVIMYVLLPPGSGEKAFISLSRHDWGDIHFWTAVIFTLILVIHLVLHSAWIVNSYNLFKKKKRT